MASENRITVEKTGSTVDELQQHVNFLREAYPDHTVVFALTPGGHAHFEVWRPGYGPTQAEGPTPPDQGKDVEHYLNERRRRNDNVNMGVNGAL